ncbi:MAG: hypothetical protein R3B45_11495 [Bdellovibrionota bacterium]
MSSSAKPIRDHGKESIGWIYLAAVILIFPALFFACVFFPIWYGLTPVFP